MSLPEATNSGSSHATSLRTHADGVLGRAKNLAIAFNQLELTLGIGNQLNAVPEPATLADHRAIGMVLGDAACELDTLDRRLNVIIDHLG